MMLSTRRFGELGDTGETRGTRILVSDSELFHALCSSFCYTGKMTILNLNYMFEVFFPGSRR